jgi:N utilization substance protein A
MKGMRVQSIIRELRGEKIDIIEYNEDPLVFAANALSPAKINHVSVLEVQEKHLEVIVDDTQLSLAIGKKGQNVRLAAKLLGWHIDIKSEEEKRQEIESQMAAMALRGAPITELEGLGAKTLEKLRLHGIETVEQLAQMTPENLMQIQGVGEKTVERIRRVVTDYFERDQSGAAVAAENSEAAGEAEGVAAAGESSETSVQEAEGPSALAEGGLASEEPTRPAGSATPEPPVEGTGQIESSGEREPRPSGEPKEPEAGGGEQ